MSSKYTVVVATDLTEEGLNILREADDIELIEVAPNPQAITGVLEGAHAIITREDVRFDRVMLGHAPELRIIARVSPTVNGVDMDIATQRGIMVMNTPGVSAIAAGEHALALMLALSRRITSAHNSLAQGFWLLDRRRQAGTQLAGKTLGIIGLGRVGSIVAQRALAFGMTVLAYDPYVREDQMPDDRIQLVGNHELYERSDFITLHVPSTGETRGMIDADTLALFKRGARLINTSSGDVVDEQAIADALKSGQLAGMAVDVYHEEPPYNSPLIGLENVIHTPHIGDNTIEATQDLSLSVVVQVLDALRDEDYRNVVNMPLMPGLDYEAIRPAMRLAECIGKLIHTLARGAVQRVAVEVRGEDLAGLIKPVTVGILKGLLAPVHGEKVSYINAPVLANDRGWQVTQVKGLRSGDYSNALLCQVTLDDGEDITITGTLLDHKEPHIVRINQYRMNFVPEGHLLLMGSFDRPGVIGRVGTLMADHQVNIASWHTGRAEPGGHTLTVLGLDEPLPENVFEALQQFDFIRHAHQVMI